jgi:hypothetical protein
MMVPMDDPFDRARWPLPRLAVELDDLAVRSSPPQGAVDMGAVDWAVDQLLDGATPAELCEAALWVGVRRGRADGRGPHGLVTHAVLAAAACRSLGGLALPMDERAAAMAAVQHVAYTLGAYRGGVNDDQEGPRVLAWFEPRAASGDAVLAFQQAVANGECDLADHRWLDAAQQDPDAAEEALISAGAAGYHLNEHKLVYPAQLRAWIGSDAEVDPVLFRVAARYGGNHLQDPTRADTRRADAAALVVEAEERGKGAAGDLERVSVVATGIARTPQQQLTPLLMGSLAEGLDPADLVLAVSLVTASRYSATPFGDTGPIGAVHAGTGANAVRRCMARTSSPELRYELAICSTESPQLPRLARVEELAVPPYDDGALEDLLDALDAGDPDAASDAACAVPPDDPESVATAWAAVLATGATDQWMLLHGIKHSVAMYEDFVATAHPARIWYLAAAARTAAHATAMDQPVAREVERRLG